MARDRIDILFPLRGVDRGASIQNAPPYSCRDAHNVWPRAEATQRESGGTRPGLRRAFLNQLGGGQPVRMLTQSRDGLESEAQFIDEFTGTALGTDWGT